MRMIDEDEVGLKEKPEDTRYIKKITGTSKHDPKHWECRQRNLIPTLPLLGLRTRGGGGGGNAGASNLKAPSEGGGGEMKCPSQVAPTTMS